MEPTPAAAVAAFGDRLPLAERYARLLVDTGAARGLIGPGEAGRIWSRHLLNSVSLADLIPEGSTVADMGSGAGLPGLVLAIARPDLRVTLIEPLLRRATFLRECVAELSLAEDRVEVVRARAEELARSLPAVAESAAPSAPGARAPVGFDVVVARAVAPLPRLLRWCLPLLPGGGELLALKGADAERELAQARQELGRWPVTESAIVRIEPGYGGPTSTVIRIRVGASTPGGRTGRKPGQRSRPTGGRVREGRS